MEDNGYFIKTLFNKYAMPSILVLLSFMGGSFINTVMAGAYFDSAGLAAIGVCIPITCIFAAFGALFGIGAANKAAAYTGRDDLKSVNALFGTSILLTAVCAVVLLITGYVFADKIATFLSGGEEFYSSVHSYLLHYLPFGFFIMLQYPILHFSRIDGNPQIGVYMYAMMVALNIAFNLLFAGLLGMDVGAMALGTGAAAAGACLVGLLLIKRKSLGLKIGRPRVRLTREIFTAGSPASLSNLFTLLRTFVLNSLLLSLGGESSVAVFSIVASIVSITTAPVYGLGQAMMPLVGIFGEESDNASIRQIIKRAFMWGGAITALCLFFILLFPSVISALYNVGSPEIQGLLGTALIYLAISLAPGFVNILLTYYYMAVNKIILSNILTFTREIFIAVIFAYVLSAQMGVTGVWLSLPLLEITALAAVLLCSYIYRRKNRSLTPLFLMDSRIEEQGKFISFSVDTNENSIANASEKIMDFCVARGMATQKAIKISMAVEEIVTIMANNNINSSVAVRLMIMEEDVTMRIRNGGKRFNIIDYYNENISSDIEKSLEVIGLKYIIGSSKSIRFRETFGVNNLVIIL